MAGFRIRSADRNDIPVILKFMYQLDSDDGLAAEFRATEDNLAELFFSDDKGGEAWILEVEGNPQGVVVFSTILFASDGCRSLYITKIYITPEYRQRGFGKSLIQHCTALAGDRGYAKVVWGVNDGNIAAQKFYKKIAQEISGVRWFCIDAQAKE